MIEVIDIEKKYYRAGSVVNAIESATFTIARGDFVVIRGASGSGKSSLLNILGCLDRPTKGKYVLDGVDVSLLDDRALSRIRAEKIGFVFQSFHLLPKTTALENVELPMIYANRKIDKNRAVLVLERVGLGHRKEHYDNELSGGEQQRVAIARALINDPELILADEPTGNLDETASMDVLSILSELNREGRTLVLVTHNDSVAAYAKTVFIMQNGVLRTQGVGV